MKCLALFLGFISVSAFADRSVAVLDNSSGQRVVLESDATSAVRFYECNNQTDVPLASLDLNLCAPLVGGRSFSRSQFAHAMYDSGSRIPLVFLLVDSVYGVREAVRYMRDQPVDGRNETTYMGSAEGYGLARNPTSQIKFISAFLRAQGRDMGTEENSVIYVGPGASGDFRGVRDGVTALLLYAPSN